MDVWVLRSCAWVAMCMCIYAFSVFALGSPGQTQIISNLEVLLYTIFSQDETNFITMLTSNMGGDDIANYIVVPCVF